MDYIHHNYPHHYSSVFLSGKFWLQCLLPDPHNLSHQLWMNICSWCYANSWLLRTFWQFSLVKVTSRSLDKVDLFYKMGFSNLWVCWPSIHIKSNQLYTPPGNAFEPRSFLQLPSYRYFRDLGSTTYLCWQHLGVTGHLSGVSCPKVQ